MVKQTIKRHEDDDYFAEPNYDNLTDAQLDELYYFGELRTPVVKGMKKRRKSIEKINVPTLFSIEEQEYWLDPEFDGSDDLWGDG